MIPDMTDEEIMAALAEGNPELRALELKAEAERAGAELAEKGYYPDVTFGVELIQTDHAREGNPVNNGDDPVVATVSFNIPLWFSARKASVDEALSREQAFRQKGTGELDRLRAALQLVLFEVSDAARRIDLYKNTLLPKAEQSLAATLDAFQTGSQTVLDLIDVERTLLEFQLSYLRARTDQGQSMAELETLVGHEIPCKVHREPLHLPRLGRDGDG